MKRVLFPLFLSLAAAACAPEGSGDQSNSQFSKPSQPMAVRAEATDAATEATEATEAAGSGADIAPASAPALAPMLAYEYRVGVEAPAANVRGLHSAHEAACRQAGASRCLIVNASVSQRGDDAVYAELALRAEPRWLEAFRADLAADAKAAGGRIVDETATSEDLTRSIVDTEARLNAQKTLRDRLRQILRERPGKLGELLETERELARVQGEIDSAESLLAVMRQRVAMSHLTLPYESKPSAVAGGTFEPITNALVNFFSVVAYGIAAIIQIIAVALPFALVLGPLAWFVLRRRAKARALEEKAE